jgi:hypothetical protein
MHSAMFVAKFPEHKPEDWTHFLGAVSSILKDAKHARRLAENVWLVNFQAAPSALSWLVTTAERLDIPYGILPFDAEPQWLPVGFDPSTIQVQSAGS